MVEYHPYQINNWFDNLFGDISGQAQLIFFVFKCPFMMTDTKQGTYPSMLRLLKCLVACIAAYSSLLLWHWVVWQTTAMI